MAFSVRQKLPATLIEAVSANIEMEYYLKPKPTSIVQIEPVRLEIDTVTATVQHKQNAMMGMLESIMTRLEKLEAGMGSGQPQRSENAESRTS